jgi:hypothetical protein
MSILICRNACGHADERALGDGGELLVVEDDPDERGSSEVCAAGVEHGGLCSDSLLVSTGFDGVPLA